MNEEYWEKMDPDCVNLDDIDEDLMEGEVPEADAKQEEYVATYQSLVSSNKNFRFINMVNPGSTTFDILRECLVTNFKMQYNSGLIVRPKLFKSDTLMHKCMNRVEMLSYQNLHVAPSMYHVVNHDGSTVDIG